MLIHFIDYYCYFYYYYYIYNNNNSNNNKKYVEYCIELKLSGQSHETICYLPIINISVEWCYFIPLTSDYTKEFLKKLRCRKKKSFATMQQIKTFQILPYRSALEATVFFLFFFQSTCLNKKAIFDTKSYLLSAPGNYMSLYLICYTALV